MRYAIFGDIHGNLEALEAVLEKLEQEKPDVYVCIGDIVGYGADPSACIKRIKEIKNCIITAGNHDFATAGILNTDFFNTYAVEAINWTARQLTEAELEFLRHLKLVQRLNNITAVHSNLYSPEMFEYIQTTYDVQLGFNNLETSLCFVGHSHIPVVFSLQRGIIAFVTEALIKLNSHNKTIVNVGSVGQPRDENPEACYVIYDGTDSTIWTKRVAYDIEKATDKIIRAGLPDILAERLKYGR